MDLTSESKRLNAEIEKLLAEQIKLREEAMKLTIESRKLDAERVKISREVFWQPVGIAIAFIAAVSGATVALLKLFGALAH